MLDYETLRKLDSFKAKAEQQARNATDILERRAALSRAAIADEFIRFRATNGHMYA
jgi:hypothetical protein